MAGHSTAYLSVTSLAGISRRFFSIKGSLFIVETPGYNRCPTRGATGVQPSFAMLYAPSGIF
jgi:hypothetical protein